MEILGELVEATPDASLFEFFKGWGIRQVTPRPPTANIRHNMLRRTDGCGYLGDIVVGHVEAENLSGLKFGERLIVEVFTLWHLSSMPSGEIHRRLRRSVTFNRVSSVVFLSTPAEMVWIAAWRIITRMQRVWVSYRRFPVTKEASNP